MANAKYGISEFKTPTAHVSSKAMTPPLTTLNKEFRPAQKDIQDMIKHMK